MKIIILSVKAGFVKIIGPEDAGLIRNSCQCNWDKLKKLLIQNSGIHGIIVESMEVGLLKNCIVKINIVNKFG